MKILRLRASVPISATAKIKNGKMSKVTTMKKAHIGFTADVCFNIYSYFAGAIIITTNGVLYLKKSLRCSILRRL